MSHLFDVRMKKERMPAVSSPPQFMIQTIPAPCTDPLEKCGGILAEVQELHDPQAASVERVIVTAVAGLALQQKRALLLCLTEQTSMLPVHIRQLTENAARKLLAAAYPQRPEKYGDWRRMWHIDA